MKKNNGSVFGKTKYVVYLCFYEYRPLSKSEYSGCESITIAKWYCIYILYEYRLLIKSNTTGVN